jgi:hypothetical protein
MLNRIKISKIALNLGILVIGMTFGLAITAHAQTMKDVFQPGEQLVYNVKYGFIKLGTVVIETGPTTSDGKINTRMRFWTADVPFLNAKSTVTDQVRMKDLMLTKFSEKAENGSDVTNKQILYDPASKTLTYSDDKTSSEVQKNIEPFDDALTLLFAMRSWSGAVGHKYVFEMRTKDGPKPTTITFTDQISNEQVAALDDKEVRTRVLLGNADMGSSAPLGASGDFTAYVSDDNAAVPVRIDMKIAVGSISLTLDKIKRNDWTAAK